MSNDKKPKFSIITRIAWITGIACVACCVLPLLGIALGSASVAGLAIYSEKAAALLAAIGVGVLIVKRLFRKSATVCDIDGSCAPRKASSEVRENS